MATTQQVTATPRNSSNNAIPGKTPIWSSSNTGVATVNSSGLVSAVAAGGAVIRAVVDGVEGVANCTVTQPTQQSFRLERFLFGDPNVNIQTNQTVTFYVDVVRLGGFTGTVAVQAPTGISGLTVTVGLNEGSLGSSVNVPNGTNSFAVSVTAASGAASGARVLNIAGTSGSLAANFIMQVNVSESASPSLDGSAATYTLASPAQGSSVSTVITIVRNGGYTGDVTPVVTFDSLSTFSPQDPKATVTFSPAVISAGSTTTTVTMSRPAGHQYPAQQQAPSFIVQLTGSGVPSKQLPTFSVV